MGDPSLFCSETVYEMQREGVKKPGAPKGAPGGKVRFCFIYGQRAAASGEVGSGKRLGATVRYAAITWGKTLSSWYCSLSSRA